MKVNRRFAPYLNSRLNYLESRNLLSGGISTTGGVIQIEAPLPSGNTTEVHHDAVLPVFDVTLNGVVTAVPDAGVTQILYIGALGGHDTFTNATGLLSVDVGYGGNNVFNAGSGVDIMFVFGDNNVLNSTSGGDTYVFTHGGNDTLNGSFVFISP